MKLTTFLAFIAFGAVCAVAGFAAALHFAPEPPPPAPVLAPPAVAVPTMPTPPVEASTAAAPTSAPTVPAGARDIDTFVLSYVGKDIGSDKIKDASRGTSWKVNVYQDSGSTTANRAKVDLDRDDKWDEKFTFAEGKITRQVAPADDEVYTEEYRWDGQGWK